jgi:hypothetical protein
MMTSGVSHRGSAGHHHNAVLHNATDDAAATAPSSSSSSSSSTDAVRDTVSHFRDDMLRLAEQLRAERAGLDERERQLEQRERRLEAAARRLVVMLRKTGQVVDASCGNVAAAL